MAGKHCWNILNQAKGGVAKVVNVMNTPPFSSSVPPGEITSSLTSTPQPITSKGVPQWRLQKSLWQK